MMYYLLFDKYLEIILYFILFRIKSRFAKDVDVCDNALPQYLRQWLSQLSNFFGTIILIITVIPWFTLVILPIGVLFFFVQKVYVSKNWFM